MTRAPGRQCAVDGCGKSGIVGVFFPGGSIIELRDVKLDGEVVEALNVCREHGERLGRVEDLAAEYEDEATCLAVTLDLDTLEPGWRLVVEIRPSGNRHVVVLYPPEVAA